MTSAPESGGGRRLGMKLMAPSDMRRVGRVTSLIYIVCGISIVQLWALAGDAVAHPLPYLASGLTLIGVWSLLLLSVRFASDETIDAFFAAFMVAAMFGGAVLVPVVLYLVGFVGFAIGSAVYMLPLIFAFWLLTRMLAVMLLAIIGVGHAVLLSVSDGVVAPVSQWTFLFAVLAAAGFLVGGLVDEIDRAGQAELEARRALAVANLTLEVRVAEQVDEIGRMGRLRRFLSPQVADAVLSTGSEAFLAAHRREIAVFFCDLRGFTAFSGEVEPEEVVTVLNDYYEVIGTKLHEYDATVGSFAGDGIMAYFNDPNPCDRPAHRAVEMALGLREPMEQLRHEWERRGYRLGYGIGIALGHATLGVIGFEGRSDYTPLGTVVNLASRLCDQAQSRQILIDRRTHVALDGAVETSLVDTIPLKGFSSPVPVYEVVHADRVAGESA